MLVGMVGIEWLACSSGWNYDHKVAMVGMPVSLWSVQAKTKDDRHWYKLNVRMYILLPIYLLALLYNANTMPIHCM